MRGKDITTISCPLCSLWQQSEHAGTDLPRSRFVHKSLFCKVRSRLREDLSQVSRSSVCPKAYLEFAVHAAFPSWPKVCEMLHIDKTLFMVWKAASVQRETLLIQAILYALYVLKFYHALVLLSFHHPLRLILYSWQRSR